MFLKIPANVNYLTCLCDLNKKTFRSFLFSSRHETDPLNIANLLVRNYIYFKCLSEMVQSLLYSVFTDGVDKSRIIFIVKFTAKNHAF